MQDINNEIRERILKLKSQRKAVILAHNYQLGEVQDIADFVGDSLELSQKASRTDAWVILFCGVHFMAETASILCPDKTVLLPDLNAGCPMANMITAPEFNRKEERASGNSTPTARVTVGGRAAKSTVSIHPAAVRAAVRPIAITTARAAAMAVLAGETGGMRW